MRENLAKLESKSSELSKKMDELVQLERQFRDMVNDLKHELMKDVQNVRLPGVVIHENEKCTFAVVSSRNFSSKNWSPEYYIPKSQAKAVVEALEHCTTVDGICKKIGTMLIKGYVGDSADNRVYLNDFTLSAIQNSDIGVYVTAHNYADKKPNAYCVTFMRGSGLYEVGINGKTTSEVSATFAKTFPDASIMSIKCVKRGIDIQPAM